MFQLDNALEKFYSSVPKTPLVLKEYPSLITFANTVKQGEALLKNFAKKGIFNAIPLGKVADDFIVMRISPDGRRSFGIVYKDYPTGITLSSSSNHLILSALVFSDLSFHYFSKGDTEYVGEFAKFFGESEMALRKFWEAFPQYDAVIGGIGARRGQLWEVLGNITGDEFFSSIAKCWLLRGSELLEWASHRELNQETFPIISRAILGAKFYETEVDDLERSMRTLLKGDDIFDSTYWGAFDGVNISRMEMRVSVASIEHLSQKYGVDPELADIWDALIAFSKNPEKYNGLEHLKVATEIAKDKPILAFHMANNGSAFHRYIKGRKSKEFFEFLQALAQENEWHELQVLYGWLAPLI